MSSPKPRHSCGAGSAFSAALQGRGPCAMGLWMSRLLSMFGDKEARILVLGLDNAGKTTILCELTAVIISCSILVLLCSAGVSLIGYAPASAGGRLLTALYQSGTRRQVASGGGGVNHPK